MQYIGYLGITGSFRVDPVICKQIKNTTGRRILYSYERVLDGLSPEELAFFISLIREDDWKLSNFSERDQVSIWGLVELGLLMVVDGIVNINKAILWNKPVPVVRNNLSNW